MATAVLQGVLALSAMESRCTPQLYPDPTPGCRVDFPGRKPSLMLEGSHEHALPRSPADPQHASW